MSEPIPEFVMKRCFSLPAAVLAFAATCAIAQSDKPDVKSDEKPAVKVQPAKGEQPKEKPVATLKVGDMAPKLEVDKWIKGEPVTSFEKGKVYVIEFWATWCPPCKKSIPHLTELQKEFKDAVIIGVDSSENHWKPCEPEHLEKAEKFVKEWGDKMNYRVAFDSKVKMWETWAKPAAQQGIPCAFIVGKEGKLTWIGNPLNPAFGDELAKAMGVEKKPKEKKEEGKN